MDTILSCASSTYNSMSWAARNYSSACSTVFNSCQNYSADGNLYWTYNVCYKNVLMGIQDNVPSPNATDLAACRLQQPITEIQGPCNQLAIHCRSAGFAYGVALPGCINDLTLKNLLPKYDAIKADPDLVLSCANAKYTWRTFSTSCSHVFQKCQEISGGNNYWAFQVCFVNAVVALKVPGLNITDQAALTQCRIEEPVLEIKGPCNQLQMFCRVAGYNGPAVPECRLNLMKGFITNPKTLVPMPKVNESYIEGCRLEKPIEGVSKTPCDRINIICRQSGFSGAYDGVLWPFCHLPLLQGNTTVPGSDLPLPAVNASLIQDCKALMLSRAISINPQPYYYDIGYTMINMQNMTIAQYDEINKLMIASKASVNSYDDFTPQQIYDLEIAENIRWRALSTNFSLALNASSDDMDPLSTTPITTRITRLYALYLKLYGYWREIYMIAFIKRWRQYSFTPTPLARLSILTSANAGNATLRTILLNKRIARVSKDLGLLQVLAQTLSNSSEIDNVTTYSQELQQDVDFLVQYRDNFNSTFWDSDRLATINSKLLPVKSLLNLDPINYLLCSLERVCMSHFLVGNLKG